jgi:S-DNA-T family DNA segregation ATPase FtsK/SpoIIIE
MAKRPSATKSPTAKKKSYAAARKKNSRTRSTKRKTKTRSRKSKSSWQKLTESIISGQTLGVVMALTGIFTTLALFSSQRGRLTAWWIDQMSLLFGIGVYWLPVVLIVSGIFIFLFSQGHRGAFTLKRFSGFLLFWVALQAIVHLVGISRGSASLIDSPRPGDFGGMMGWGIAQTLASFLGVGMATLLTVLALLTALILIFGIRGKTMIALLVAAMTALALLGNDAGARWRNHLWPAISSRLGALGRWIKQLLTRRKLTKNQPAPVALDEGPVSTLPPEPQEPVLTRPEPEVRIIGSESGDWRLPRIEDILDATLAGEITEEDLAERARTIEDTLHAFGVPVTVVEVNKGPVVTQFGVKPGYVIRKVRGEERKMKIRVSKIQTLSNDLSLALAASPIRIEAPVPGRDIVGIEVPNQAVSMVTLRSILESEDVQAMKSPLKVALGQDVSGRAVAASLSRMPHLLIAGATGSGKSVCVNAIICSLLFEYTPEELRFIMVDPKRVELTIYNGIPHLIDDVITEVETVVAVLGWAVKEMESRYKKLEKAGVRNIEGYNAKMVAEGKEKMTYTVIIIDELADIMMMAPDEVEKLLVRLAQMARAVGIHMVLATQRPSVNVVTGLIKANFPSRVAFAVTSQIDSRVILDTPGAEKLLGQGDMLFMRPDSAKLSRLQGAFVSDAEVHRLVRYWRGQRTSAQQPQEEEAPAIQRPLWEDVAAQAKTKSRRDVLYDDAVQVIMESGRASTSLLQRRLQIGYTRAARLIDMMEADGVIGPDLGGSRGRKILIQQQPEARPETTPPATPEPVAPPQEELPGPEISDSPPWDDFDDEWEDPSEAIV